MAKQLPAKWRAWIDRLVAKVDYEKELRQKELMEQVWSELEWMAAPGNRRR